MFGHAYDLKKNNAQLITWSFLMFQSVRFTTATFEAFSEAFLDLPRLERNVEAIKFLGILKKYVSKNKIYFRLKQKSNNSLNKKIIFVFQTVFKLDLIAQIIYCIIHRCLYSLFILFLFSCSVSKKWNIETVLTFLYSYNWQKLNNKMNE